MRVLVIAMAIVAAICLLLLAVASANSPLLSGYFQQLLWVNAGIAIGLLVLLLFQLFRLVRQRRQHTVVGLALAAVISLFLAFTTGSIVLVYAFTLSLIGLIGYCYWLVQLRVQRESTRYMRQFRNRAA